MQSILRFCWNYRYVFFIAGGVLALLSGVAVHRAYAESGDAAKNGRLVTIHDRGETRVVLTSAHSVEQALRSAGVALSDEDIIEPKLDTELVAASYVVNIYRARPVVVVDGAVRQKVMTAAQSAHDIAMVAAVASLQDDDKVSLASGNITTDGAGVVLTIHRAVPFTLQLYGKPVQTYSHADTVGEMLQQKGVVLAKNDTVSVAQDTKLTSGMTVAIWRQGVQTATVDEPVAYTVRRVLDYDRPVGYRQVQTPGVNGSKSVTYDITIKDGRETGRKVIQTVKLSDPTQQVEVIGAKAGPNALSKSKGAQYFTDSKGVSHRETYYDLPMNSVMSACGGGTYTVRPDGAKVDKDGYILIAAHLGNYPRCSLVETSMGLGKVYDTGGFTAKHPHGFDLATDWSNSDGR